MAILTSRLRAALAAACLGGFAPAPAPAAAIDAGVAATAAVDSVGAAPVDTLDPYGPYGTGTGAAAAPVDSGASTAAPAAIDTAASRAAPAGAGDSAAAAPMDAAARTASGDSSGNDGTMELEEKRVKGRSSGTHREKEVSRIRLGRDELRKVAAAQGNPLKVLGTLPGVTNQNDLSVRPFVRGGKAEETQVLWEGFPLLQPYHFSSIYSIFNMEALEDMTLYSGGFPASTGNALSAAVFMRSRQPPLDSLKLFLNLSLLRGVAHVGVPLIKNRLAASFSYQAFWYDWMLDRGMDAVDVLSGDSAYSAQKRRFQRYLDLPNFRDYQFGLAWHGDHGIDADYTGIVSRDVFTVRDIKDRLYVNGGEVSPTYYDWNLFYRPEDTRRKLRSWDSLAVVSVDNSVHAMRFHWRPGGRWEADQGVAWQSQNWRVGFLDQDEWNDSIAPDGRFAGSRSPGESDYLFNLRNETLDWRLDARRAGDAHRLEMGLSQSMRSSTFHTQMPRPIYEIIVNGNVDALDALGFIDPRGFVIRRGNPLSNPNTDYLTQLPRLIRFDYEGEQSGSFLGAYLSDEWAFDARHRLTLGLRAEADTYAGIDGVFLSPRVAWFQSLGPRDELTLASGLYSQSDYPFFIRASNPDLRPEKAFHANAEWTHAFSKRFRLECQVYQKNYFDLAVPSLVNTGKIDLGSLGIGIDSAAFNALDPAARQLILDRLGERRLEYRNGGLGKAGGIEMSFFYNPNKTWSGWLSAEVGYSKRLDNPGSVPYDFRQSRPWAFNWVNYFHMPSNYELSLRGRFAAGLPYTDYTSLTSGSGGPGGGFEEVDGGGSAGSDTLFYAGPRNGKRYSSYSRWDLRLSKDIRLGRHSMQSYFEIWNAFNTPNFMMSDASTGKWKFVDLNYPIPILFLGLSYRW